MTELIYTNIFDAIYKDKREAADVKFRADIMLVLRDIFNAENLNQSEIMARLGISQPRASELMRGKVDKFSSDKLIGFLALVGYRFDLRSKIDLDRLSVECCINYG